MSTELGDFSFPSAARSCHSTPVIGIPEGVMVTPIFYEVSLHLILHCSDLA